MARYVPNRPPTVRPSDFPDEQYPYDIKFLQDMETSGKMDLEVFRELWDRACIEVDNLPDANLRNATHPCFARERFSGYLNDQQYEAIEPAVTLASRLLTDEHYIKFFTTLLLGERTEFTRRVKSTVRREHYFQGPDSWTMTNMRTKIALKAFAPNIKWFGMDETWSAQDAFKVAETFMDRHDRRCKRYQVFNGGLECGTCAYCVAVKRGTCFICGYRDYRRFEGADLREVHKSRGMRGFHGKPVAQLRAELEADDDTRGTCPATPEGIVVPDGKFSDIQIGLHADLKKHLVDKNKEDWTYCEEVRFQFGVAATLVHELTHSFWYFAQKRCWNCFKNDPWFSEEEPKKYDPEIGNSWEFWAFGTRVPRPGRVRIDADEVLPNLFSQHQWSYVISTEAAGESKSHEDAVKHDFILPVEYINSWFLESTWKTITRLGRLAGRPNHDDSVLLRLEARKVKRDGSFGSRKCTLERYSYRDLVANGGLEGPLRRAWKYGTKWATKPEVEKRIRNFIRQRTSKQREEDRKRAAGEQRVKNAVVTPKRAQRNGVTKRMARRPTPSPSPSASDMGL